MTGRVFTINGRFYSQKLTGVQRYAREITREIDGILQENGSDLSGRLVVQRGAELPQIGGLELDHRAGAGIVWEQTRLPTAAQGPLLCFGNTGPIGYRHKILCVHDVNFQGAAKSYSRTFRMYMNTMLPLMVRTSQRVVTVSRFSADRIERAGLAGHHAVEVVPNGHEHALRWRAERSALAGDSRLAKPFVLLVGSLAQHKNWQLIATIAPELIALGVEIVAVGAGAGKEFAALSQSGFERFVMLGRITDDDLAWLYCQAVCLLFPSLLEGFGLPLLEAMAIGCPVITSNVSSMPEIGGDAVVLVNPARPADWLAATAALLSSPERRADLVERGRRRAQLFSWHRSAQRYLELVREVGG